MNKNDAINWIAELFEEPPGTITEDTLKSEISAWDSLGVLTLLSGLDEKFNVQLTEGEIQGLHSVKDILAILLNKGHLQYNRQQ